MDARQKNKLKKELKKVLQSIGQYDTTDMFFIVDKENGEWIELLEKEKNNES